MRLLDAHVHFGPLRSAGPAPGRHNLSVVEAAATRAVVSFDSTYIARNVLKHVWLERHMTVKCADNQACTFRRDIENTFHIRHVAVLEVRFSLVVYTPTQGGETVVVHLCKLTRVRALGRRDPERIRQG